MAVDKSVLDFPEITTVDDVDVIYALHGIAVDRDKKVTKGNFLKEVVAANTDLAGAGRTTETVKENADDIGTVDGRVDSLSGAGHTTETVKENADGIDDLAGTGRTTETVKDNADDITDLSTKLITKDLYNPVPVGIDLVDTETGISAVNAVMSDIFGYENSIVFAQATTLAVYQYDPDTFSWSQIGSNTTITRPGDDSLCWIGGLDIALFGNGVLQTYRFNGTTFSALGNNLNHGVIGGIASESKITSLKQNQIITANKGTASTNKVFRVYEFDGTDWTAITSSEPAVSIIDQLYSVSSNVFLFTNNGTDTVDAYRFGNGTVYTFGSAQSLGAADGQRLVQLSRTLFAAYDYASAPPYSLQGVYRFDERTASWSSLLTTDIYGIPSSIATVFKARRLSNSQLLLIETGSLKVYDILYEEETQLLDFASQSVVP